MVSADRTRFAQILMNFGSNAIKYNRPSGKVTFTVSTPRTELRARHRPRHGDGDSRGQAGQALSAVPAGGTGDGADRGDGHRARHHEAPRRADARRRRLSQRARRGLRVLGRHAASTSRERDRARRRRSRAGRSDALVGDGTQAGPLRRGQPRERHVHEGPREHVREHRSAHGADGRDGGRAGARTPAPRSSSWTSTCPG